MPSILLVEDDPLMADLYVAVLQAAKLAVTRVASGKEALAHLKASQPDIMILDLMMPEMSGMEVLEKMRAVPNFAAVPVIVSSNFADEAYEKRALEAGARKYVLKSAYLPAAFVKMIKEELAAVEGDKVALEATKKVVSATSAPPKPAK
jgi:CheY-like chemotaxis protein